jgi:hypothetical protein
MKDVKMIPANLDPTVKIRESDKLFYHLRFYRLKVDPANPLHIEEIDWVLPLRDNDYFKFFGPDVDESAKIQYRKAMNASRAALAHDPMADPELKKLKLEKRDALNNLRQQQFNASLGITESDSRKAARRAKLRID